MKELVLKKRLELEEICRKTHMVADADSAMEYVIEAIESGNYCNDIIGILKLVIFLSCLERRPF